MYEQRIQQLANDYARQRRGRRRHQANDPKALRIDELDSSDISDTLDEMKIRAAYKHLTYPYLYDGDTQSVTRAYGPQATPHVFVFDQDRKLRYEGRFDNNYRIESVKTQDARDAIDALLAHKDLAVTHTGVFGCSTKWAEKNAAESTNRCAKSNAQPDHRGNGHRRGSEEAARQRRHRQVRRSSISGPPGAAPAFTKFPSCKTPSACTTSATSISSPCRANMPDEKAGVLKMLEKWHATSRNYLFASDDTAAMQKAFDPEWESAVPYTVLIAPDGQDPLQVRRLGRHPRPPPQNPRRPALAITSASTNTGAANSRHRHRDTQHPWPAPACPGRGRASHPRISTTGRGTSTMPLLLTLWYT